MPTITNPPRALTGGVSNGNQSGATAAADYTVRPYEPADSAGFLRLDRRVWNRNRGAAWFDWKYTDNPYADHIPVFVAEYDGQIVGARPFVALRLRIGEKSVVAYQPTDTMVDPDHRRSGVFKRMTAHALSAYSDQEPAMFFNFPNQHARPGYLELGWRAVRPEVTYYRVESPGAFADGVTQRAAGALGSALDVYYAGRRRLSTTPTDLTVRVVDGAATDQLATLHGRRQPATIHADRTAEFLDWRLASPVWNRETYLVESPERSEPVAALVARSRTTDDGLRLTQVIDVAPLCGPQRWREALRVGLGTVISAHAEADLFAVSDGAIPHGVLAGFGFLRDDSLPLSRLTTYDSMLVTRPNGDPNTDDAWRINGRSVDDGDNWCVTFAERDTT